MNKVVRFVVCALLIAALAVPALAEKAREKRSTVSKITSTVYGTGASLAGRTEGLVTGCLKNCFGFFNPCLDLVKKCSDTVLSPLDKPMAYLERPVAKYLDPPAPKPKRVNKEVPKIPVPEKPELPK